MKVRATLGVLAVLVLCTSRATAGDIKPLARFNAPDRVVNWIALSPDGTRLAAALSRAEPGKQYVSQVVVWDVDAGAKVSTKEYASYFNYVFFSADGSTLVTAENGFNGAGGNVALQNGLRVRGTRGYQTWDAATGKEIGAAVAPARLGEYSTAAVSPDGKYLATVFNAEVYIESSSTRPFLVRQLDIWDVKAHKVKWRVPGVAHLGRVSWDDSVAFSPDGKMLVFAIIGAGGPSSEERRDQPNVNQTRLKMVALEEGKDAAVTGLETNNPIEGGLEWASDGKLLLGRDGRTLTTYDPATGRVKDRFGLGFPAPEPPKGNGNALPLPPPPPNSTDAPDGWAETHSVLSADGSRVAAHFFRGSDDVATPLQSRAVVWDVSKRKVLGALSLQDAARPPALAQYDTPARGVRLALSGNGGRLAVGLPGGAVAVYDVSQISGLMTPTTGDAPAKEPGAAKATDMPEVRKSYEAAVLKARERLLARFDEVIAWMEKDDKAKAGAVARLKDQRDLFDKRDLVPWSEVMRKDTGHYLKAVGDARTKALADAGAGELPADLRDLIDGRVVARWVHQPGDGKIALYSSGKINTPDGENTWSFSGGRLTFRWKNDKAPGGFWVDTCVLAPDGQSYAGVNQIQTKVSGKLVTEE